MPNPENSPPHLSLNLNDKAPDELKNSEKGSLLKKKMPKKLMNKPKQDISRIEKYEALDRNHPLNKPFTGNPRFRGPVCNLKTIIVFLLNSLLKKIKESIPISFAFLSFLPSMLVTYSLD